MFRFSARLWENQHDRNSWLAGVGSGVISTKTVVFTPYKLLVSGLSIIAPTPLLSLLMHTVRLLSIAMTRIIKLLTVDKVWFGRSKCNFVESRVERHFWKSWSTPKITDSG